jgi:hypothetical protein
MVVEKVDDILIIFDNILVTVINKSHYWKVCFSDYFFGRTFSIGFLKKPLLNIKDQ